jgi:hypothetical protein
MVPSSAGISTSVLIMNDIFDLTFPDDTVSKYNLCVRCVSGITLIGNVRSQKIGKPNNLKVFLKQENQRPTENSQNIMSPMAAGSLDLIMNSITLIFYIEDLLLYKHLLTLKW